MKQNIEDLPFIDIEHHVDKQALSRFLETFKLSDSDLLIVENFAVDLSNILNSNSDYDTKITLINDKLLDVGFSWSVAFTCHHYTNLILKCID